MSSDFEIGDFDPAQPSGVIEAMYAAGISGRLATHRGDAERRREREMDSPREYRCPADPPGSKLGTGRRGR